MPWMLALPAAAAAATAAAAAGSGVAAPNLALGTMAIYGPTWDMYNTTTSDVLTEQAAGIAAMGGNQLKLRLAPSTTCSGYRLACGSSVTSLKTLSEVPAVAAALAHPDLTWYQVWLYSFANLNWQKRDWTDATLAAEYEETKEWAVAMLEAHSGTGKVFMAGNWEGDWMLMGASGCKKPYNMSCDPTERVIQRMVQWGQTRQRAIDDARSEANADNVFIYYYMEMNLGPEAVEGKPGVTNQVLPAVNPDLVSYSSYSATNAYQKTSDVAATDKAFHAVLDYVHGKLAAKDTAAMRALGFQKRLFVGEFGAHPSATPTDFEVNRYVARVASAALRWGTPLVLYWEFYDTETIGIVPRARLQTPRYKLPLYRFFSDYYKAAKAFAGSTPPPSSADLAAWAARYFEAPAKGSCACETNTGYDDVGYSFPATSPQGCCDLCAADPTCRVGVHAGGTCYLKLGTGGKKAGDGTACVKKRDNNSLPA